MSAAGDVNGDGLADVIIGAPGADPGGRTDAGSAYVVFGSATAQTIELSGLVSAAKGIQINGAAGFDRVGTDVSGTGDYNADGLADVIIGAPDADPIARSLAGAAYVIFGAATSQTVELSSLVSGAKGVQIIGAHAVDHAGAAVSGAGDVNGDGFADVIVGAPYANPIDSVVSGAAYVLFGSAAAEAIDLASFVGLGKGIQLNGAAASDFAGNSVAGAGDVNGDGLADVIVGAYGADPLGRSSAGTSYVVFGTSTAQTMDLANLTTQSKGWTVYGGAAGDWAGDRVAGVGDVNGDGLSDVLIGSTSADPLARSDAGTGSIIFGAKTVETIDLSLLTSSGRGIQIYGATANNSVGGRVSGAGDVNGDGAADVLVGDSVIFGVPDYSKTRADISTHTRGGDSPQTPVGVVGNGSNASSPDSRVWVDYNDAGGFRTSGKLLHNMRGGTDSARAMAVQADGKILVAGSALNRMMVARYNSNGTLDTSFGTQGRVLTDVNTSWAYNETACSILIQPDGKIVVAGVVEYLSATYSNEGIAVARYLSNGTPDTSFSGDGVVFADIPYDVSNCAAALQNDGKVVVASGSRVYRFQADGNFDSTFGGGAVSISGTASAIVVDYSGTQVSNPFFGTIVVGSSGTVSGSVRSDFILTRLKNDSTLDARFDSDGTLTTDFLGGEDFVSSLAIGSDGRIIAAGRHGEAARTSGDSFDFALSRYNADGSPDAGFDLDGRVVTAFADGKEDGAQGVVILPSGQIVAAGYSSNNITSFNFALAKYSSSGSLDGTFDGDGMLTTDFVGQSDKAVAVVYTGGGFLVAGTVFSVAGDGDVGLARYAPSGAIDPTFGTGGLNATNIAGDLDNAKAMITQSDGRILAVHRNSGGMQVTRFNSDGTVDSSFGTMGTAVLTRILTTPIYHIVPMAICLQTDGKSLVYFGGYYTGNGTSYDALIRLNINGSFDSSFGSGGIVLTGSNSNRFSMAVDTSGSVATNPHFGKILLISDSTGFVVKRFNTNGTADTTFNGTGTVAVSWGTFGGRARSVAIQSDGKIVVGGHVSPAGYDDFAVARLNPNGTLDPTFDTDGKISISFGAAHDFINSLAIQPDGKIVAAGLAAGDNKLGGASAYDFALARFNTNGSPDGSFDGDGKVVTALASGLEDVAESVTVLANGQIVAAGYAFASASSYNVAVARYSSTGALDLSFDSDGKLTVDLAAQSDKGVAVTELSGGQVLVLGTATTADGDTNLALIRLDSAGAFAPITANTSLESTTLVTRFRTPQAAGVNSLDDRFILGDVWKVETYHGVAGTTLTFKFTAEQASKFDKTLLHILSSADGVQWTFAPTDRSAIARNQLSATVDRLGYFTIGVSQATTAPLASLLNAPSVSNAGGTSYDFVVRYQAGTGVIPLQTIDGADILISGPGGFAALASPISTNPTVDAASVDVTYRLIPPNGAWTGAASGLYTIGLEPSQVRNNAGIVIPDGVLGSFTADIPLLFVDPDLELAVRTKLGLSTSTPIRPTTLTALTSLSLDSNKITSLSGLEWATGLQELSLIPQDWSTTPASLATLAPLAGLIQLRTLTLQRNGLSSAMLVPLSNLKLLTSLDLRYNAINNVAPLTGLTALGSLKLYGNSVTDLAGLGGMPVKTDLVPIRPEKANSIEELAAALHHSPLEIFQYVYNNFEYQPYAGLMKGPLATLQTRAGNDWDQSALLVELLNRSGIQTRFVTGRIETSWATREKWLGLRDTQAMIDLQYMAGLRPEKDGAQIDHAWVEASLPGLSGNQWVAMDPSFKFKDFQAGVPNILTKVPFDESGYLSKVRNELPFEYYLNQVSSYLATNYPTLSVADVGYGGPIIQRDFASFPASQPYTIIEPQNLARYGSYAAVPSSLKYTATITLKKANGAVIFSSPLVIPDNSLKRITISYVPVAADVTKVLVQFRGKEGSAERRIGRRIVAYCAHERRSRVGSAAFVCRSRRCGVGCVVCEVPIAGR